MFRPAGYSSEEENYCSEDEGMEYFSQTYDEFKATRRNEISEKQKQENRIENFYRSICYGNFESFIAFLDEGMDINYKFRDNWTPLLLACSSGCDLIALELIKRGANVNLTKELYTPLMAACSCPATTAPFEKTFRIVENLLINKADPTAKNRKRMNALMVACSTGNIDAVNLLLQYCDKEEVDNQGWTALFWAVNDNQVRVAKLLIENGFDYSKEDVRRCTPLDYAKQHGFHKIVDMLPDPNQVQINYFLQNMHFEYYVEVERPRFMRDIYQILEGTRCEKLQELFSTLDTDLLHFLTLSRDDLIKLKIEWPYIQNRLLGGLFRFHKHPFKKNSVPCVHRKDTFTTLNVAATLISAMRQITAMHAAIRYLNMNLDFDALTKSEQLIRKIGEIQFKIKYAKASLKKLNLLTKQWDKENYPVDLITCNKKKSSIFKFVKYSTPIIIISCYFVYKMKV